MSASTRLPPQFNCLYCFSGRSRRPPWLQGGGVRGGWSASRSSSCSMLGRYSLWQVGYTSASTSFGWQRGHGGCWLVICWWQRGLERPNRHWLSDSALQTLRDRSHHKPHPRLRLSHRHAGRTLPWRHCSVAESLRLTHGRAVHPGGRCLDPPDRRAVHAPEATYTVLHRQAFLQKEVRRQEDPRSLLGPVARRNRSR